MRTMLLLLVAVASCVHLPHVDPQARSPDQAVRAAVTLDVTCVSGGFEDMDPIEWYPPRTGSGVVISERHILTAAHVVACPTIPHVVATLSDGRRFMVDVVRDDAAFGDGNDIARLESASAENFGLGIAPPALGHFVPGEPAIAMAKGNPGGLMFDKDIIRGMTTAPGDSGAGVYDMYGLLIGLVSKVAVDGSYTRVVLVTPSWLEGT